MHWEWVFGEKGFVQEWHTDKNTKQKNGTYGGVETRYMVLQWITFLGQEQTSHGKNTRAGLRRLKGHTKMLNCECQPGKMASNIREPVVYR